MVHMVGTDMRTATNPTGMITPICTTPGHGPHRSVPPHSRVQAALSPDASLVRLLQLASPALPVGAYTYSQGLEWAVERGTVRDETSAGRWIGDLIDHGIGRYEAPLVGAMMKAWSAGDNASVTVLNAEFLASREAAELRAETAQMGFSLRRLLHDLRDDALAPVIDVVEPLAEVAFSDRLVGHRRHLVHRPRSGNRRLSVVVGRESGDGGAQGRAARPGRRPAPARRSRPRDSVDCRATQRQATIGLVEFHAGAGPRLGPS